MKTIRIINRIVLGGVTFTAFVILDNVGGSDLLLSFLNYFLKMAIIPLVFVELYFLIFRKKRSFIAIILLLFIMGYASFIAFGFYGHWEADIDNILKLPEGYSEDYLVVVYGAPSGESIEPSYTFKRKREIKFPVNGIYLTSTELKTTLQSIEHPTPRVFIGNKEIKGKCHNWFVVSGGVYQGYRFKVLSLYDSTYVDFDRELLFKKYNVDLRKMDNYVTEFFEATAVEK